MTNDAKLGLVVGVVMVIAVAVVFFRKEAAESAPAGAAALVAAPMPGTAHTSSLQTMRNTTSQPSRSHTVRHGESLYILAQQYYGDGKKYVEILRVNRGIVSNPDYVAPGTVLLIPDLETR